MLKNNKDWKQQAIALADTGTMSWREIARVLGKSKSTVSDWLRVHKEKELQKFYEEQKPFNEALNNSRENFFEVVEHKDLKSRLTNPKPEKKQIPFKIVTDSTKTTGTHLYIPDCQVKPNVDLEYLEWIGKYIVRKKPDVIVNAGDFADMESLSSYDKGKRSAEGKRVRADIDSAIEGMKLLLSPLHELQMKELQEFGEIRYKPRLVLTLGNHEDRINRYVNDTPSLHGFLSTDDLMYKEFGWEVVDFLTPIEIGGVFYCLAPHHKVLTRDLKYVALKDINVGDSLLAFDEFGEGYRGYRKYKTSQVLKKDMDEADLFRVTLSNGKFFDVTKEHQWLARRYGSTELKWLRTDELQIGTSCAPQLLPEWEKETSYDTGWLAGMFDGEGHISKPNCKQGGIQLGVAQNKGHTLDKILKLLDDFKVKYKVWNGSNKCQSVRILGTSGEKLRLLGMIGAQRLINNFQPEMMGRVQKAGNSEDDKVVSIEYIGKGEIVKIETSSKTMIVEGYGHHNCHYFQNVMTGKPLAGTAANMLTKIGKSFTMGHRQQLDIATRFLQVDGEQQFGLIAGACYLHEEDYKGVQGNRHWKGIVVKHRVNNGSYDPLFVSLDWLKDEYGKD